ncbi:hypothetical protein OE88DRAFT_111614 [Heliocybe sulcata]|uniref:Uncharacterized protein n=1 Tax=Heliocybe sulcata TaxID=5364 RepID=A0A5C3NIY3_9AGAM|nr:hypothetical protein OE88DRAFT_111614 [Heliocybe sulcata]
MAYPYPLDLSFADTLSSSSSQLSSPSSSSSPMSPSPPYRPRDLSASSFDPLRAAGSLASPEPAHNQGHDVSGNRLHATDGQTYLPRLRVTIPHPYARLYAKKDGAKRRRIWNHALEKSLFSAHELSTMGAPHRRTIYTASLEAHVDRLHAQLISIGFYPIPFEKLDPFKGLNSKTAKSMVAGLQHDDAHMRLKLLEIERAVSLASSLNFATISLTW